MGLFDNIFNVKKWGDAITGQQSAPQQTIIPTSDLLNQSFGALQAQVPNVAAYNNALQPVLTGLQLQNQNQIFGPAANQLQQGTYQSILDQLNLGTALPADLQQQTIQNALQGSAASGFGVGAGGRGLVARDLGLTGLNLLNQRQNTALGAVNQLPVSHYTPTPQGVLDVGSVAGMIDQEQAQRDNLANIQENLRQKNFANLIGTGARILGSVVGGVVGAYTGNPVGGVAAGGAIGQSLVPGGGVAGYGGNSQPQQSSSPFSSLLGLFGGGGGGGRFVSGTGGRPDAVTAGSVPFGGAFLG